jgi:hypothetical protein
VGASVALIHHCLCGALLCRVGADRKTRQPEGGLAAHQVLEVGVDRLALALVDELHESAQPAPHRLEHRQGDVLPPFVGLHVLDERHLLPDHRNRVLFRQEPRDLPDPVAQPLEAGVGAA